MGISKHATRKHGRKAIISSVWHGPKVTRVEQMTMEDYWEEVTMTLSSARDLAAKSLHKSQQRAKKLYDRKSDRVSYKVGDWILIRFLQEESGRN